MERLSSQLLKYLKCIVSDSIQALGMMKPLVNPLCQIPRDLHLFIQFSEWIAEKIAETI